MTVGTSQKIGQNLTAEVIHYTYPDAFRPPREGHGKPGSGNRNLYSV